MRDPTSFHMHETKQINSNNSKHYPNLGQL